MLSYPDAPSFENFLLVRSFQWIRTLIFRRITFVFDRLIALVRPLSKPNDYTTCLMVDLRHMLNLASFL